jgi:hypothetical protein
MSSKDVSRAWVLRPTVLFATAYLVNGVLHEVAHAMTAVFLNVPETLHRFRVDIDTSLASASQQALIAAGGPVFSGLFGVACAFAYRRSRGRPWQLLLLYLAALGLGMLFGNMMSASFVGDFGRMAAVLQLPGPARWIISLSGAAGLVAILVIAGMELRQWIPPAMARVKGVAIFVAIPPIAGMLLVALAYQPTSADFVSARMGESLVWVAAVVAASVANSGAARGDHRLDWHWLDLIGLMVAAAAVRAMAP